MFETYPEIEMKIPLGDVLAKIANSQKFWKYRFICMAFAPYLFKIG